MKGPEYLGAIGEGDKTSITQVASTGLCWFRYAYREGDFGLDSPAYQRPSYIQVTSCGYTDKPWEPGKQLQSGFNLVTWATSFKRVGPPIVHKLQAVNKIFYLTINLG